MNNPIRPQQEAAATVVEAACVVADGTAQGVCEGVIGFLMELLAGLFSE